MRHKWKQLLSSFIRHLLKSLEINFQKVGIYSTLLEKNLFEKNLLYFLQMFIYAYILYLLLQTLALLYFVQISVCLKQYTFRKQWNKWWMRLKLKAIYQNVSSKNVMQEKCIFVKKRINHRISQKKEQYASALLFH